MENKKKIDGEQIAIAVYKPLPDKAQALQNLVNEHHSRLHAEGLVTERRPVIIESANGIVIEIFGWKSAEAIEEAHKNDNVMKMWEEFSELCTYGSLSDLDEKDEVFPGFKPLN